MFDQEGDEMFETIVDEAVETFGPNGECLDCGKIVSPQGICDCYVPFEEEYQDFLIAKYCDEYGYEDAA
jgi:hypothetical protein